jgi:hypothetical protein
MRTGVLLLVVAALVCQVWGEEEAVAAREKRSVDGGYYRGGGGGGYHEQGGYRKVHKVVEKKYYKPPPAKQCYQCAYSPPKTYYDKQVYVEQGRYQKHYDDTSYGGYGRRHAAGSERHGGYGEAKRHGAYGGYTSKSVVPVPYTVYGGWDKCIGPFTHYEARAWGVDEWDCHSNCYTRRDPNGDVFRGCYKGEYNVDPHLTGCHKQAGSVWCFCEGDKCNNGPSPPAAPGYGGGKH